MKKKRILFLGAVVATLSACAASDETGIEDFDFDANASYAVPVSENDKPGRTVDEMLGMTPRPVNVSSSEKNVENGVTYLKKMGEARSENEDAELVSETEGRFGSKEKKALRKGLNAPADNIPYVADAVVDVEVVRGLEIEKPSVSEEPVVTKEKVIAKETDDSPVSAEEERAVLDKIVASQGPVPAVSSVSSVSSETKTVPATVVSSVERRDVSVVAPVKLTPPAKKQDFFVSQKTDVVRPLADAQKDVIRLKDPSEKVASSVVLKEPVSPYAENGETDAIGISLPLETIVFDGSKTTVTQRESSAVARAANEWKARSFAKVRVVGYDETSGKNALARAQNVADMLKGYGVPSSRIVVDSIVSVPYGQKTGRYAELFLEY